MSRRVVELCRRASLALRGISFRAALSFARVLFSSEPCAAQSTEKKMDDILALQRQLASAQLSSTAPRLSERNCIELVIKLQSLRLIDLIFTRDGREYITPAHLVAELADEIAVRGGRVNVTDLPDALNVDLSYIEAALVGVLDEGTRVFNGEIVTAAYLGGVAADVELGLEASVRGVDDVGSIAERTGLPVGVVRECVKKHAGGVISASFDEATGVLRSEKSRVRDMCAARGALKAASAPVRFIEIAQRIGVARGIVGGLAAEMVNGCGLRGRVEGSGDGGRFVPEVFEWAAGRVVLEGFLSDGFVTLERLRSMSVARESVVELGVAVEFEGVLVGRGLLDYVEGVAVEAIEAGSWLDFETAVPADFPLECVPHVLGVECKKSGGFTGLKSRAAVESEEGMAVRLGVPIFDSRYLVSSLLLEKCWTCLRADAEKRGRIRAGSLTQMLTVAGGQTRSLTGEGANALPSEILATELQQLGKRRGTRRKKDKPATSGRSNPDISSSTSIGSDKVPIHIPSVKETCSVLERNAEVRQALASDFIGSPGRDGEKDILLCVVRGGLFGGGDRCGSTETVRSLYERAALSAVTDRANLGRAYEKTIVSGLERAELFNSTADTLLRVSETAVSSSRASVLEAECAKTAMAVIHLLATSLCITLPRTTSTSPSAIHKANQHLPQDIASLTKGLVSSIASTKSTNILCFLTAYDTCAETLDLPLRQPLNKERSIAISSSIRGNLAASLSKEPLPSIDALRACAILLHAQRTDGAVVHISPASVPALCAALEGDTSETSAGAALRALRVAVTAQLRGASDGMSVPVVDDDLRQLVEAVRSFVHVDL